MNFNDFIYRFINSKQAHVHSSLEPLLFSGDARSKFYALDLSIYLFFLDKCTLFYCLNTKSIMLVEGKDGFNGEEYLHQIHNILINSTLQKEYNQLIFKGARENVDPLIIKNMHELYKEVHKELSDHLDY